MTIEMVMMMMMIIILQNTHHSWRFMALWILGYGTLAQDGDQAAFDEPLEVEVLLAKRFILFSVRIPSNSP